MTINDIKINEQIEKLEKVTEDFPAFIFIGVGKKYGGFANVQAKTMHELKLLQAEILATFKRKTNLMDMMKKSIEEIELAAK